MLCENIVFFCFLNGLLHKNIYFVQIVSKTRLNIKYGGL